MKTKLEGTLVNFALDYNKCKKFVRIYLIANIIAVVLLFMFSTPKIPLIIWGIINIAILMFEKCLDAIWRNRLILDRNKLVNIIFSNKDFCYYLFLLAIMYPIFFLIVSKVTTLIFIVCTIVLALVNLFFSDIISKHFDKKLKKIEMLF